MRRWVKGAQVEAGESPLATLSASIRSWAEHLRHGNTIGLRKAILGQLRIKLPRPAPRSAAGAA
jgi:hypothetical protein